MIQATVILISLLYLLTLLVSSYGKRFVELRGNRSTLPLGIGIFTMAATWIGGGFINGTAESSFSHGIISTQAPVAYALSMILGGLLFCKVIYERGYETFIDPIKSAYGRKQEAFIAGIAVFSEVIWTAAILVALGQSFAVVFDISSDVVIIISAIVAVLYTAKGGMAAVAVTDVLQLFLLVIGLLISFPFFMGELDFSALWSLEKESFKHELSELILVEPSTWKWWDSFLLLTFGGIPWGVYFQRVVSMRSAKSAKVLSICAGIICFTIALLPLLAGLFIKHSNLEVSNPSLVLPLAIKTMCPPLVGAFGIAAISCAVMSSIDSTILSSSQLITQHIIPKHKLIANPRYLICSLVGALSVTLALKVQSVYALWYLCSEFVYIFIFPHFVSVLICKHFNKKVFWLSNLVALTIRLTIPIEILNWTGMVGQTHVPIKSLAMLSCLSLIILFNLVKEYYPTKPLGELYEKA